MVTIELSVMPTGLKWNEADLRALLKQFEARYRIHVHLTTLKWPSAWTELVKIAIYKHGPDVSQIGSTWTSNLLAMEALYPFAPFEINSFGGGTSFLGPLWASTLLPGDPRAWAVPWLADTRIMCYRRDWLAQAGIVDAARAFESAGALEETVRRLSQHGVGIPWVMPSRAVPTIIHHIANWVWGAGGEFVSADGQRTRFTEPAALEAMRSYLALGQYLRPDEDARRELELGGDRLFYEGRAAVLLGYASAVHFEREQLGMAAPLGVPFVGGSHLAIWRHSRETNAAIELVRFLTSCEALLGFSQHMGALPARLDALQAPILQEDPAAAIAIAAMQRGRTFPALPRWGLLEDRLVAALGHVAASAVGAGAADIDALLHAQLDPVARQLDRRLTSR